MWGRLAAILVIVALVAAACGDGGRDDSSGDDGDSGGGETADTQLVDAADCDASAFTDGVTDESIKIGSSFRGNVLLLSCSLLRIPDIGSSPPSTASTFLPRAIHAPPLAAAGRIGT